MSRSTCETCGAPVRYDVYDVPDYAPPATAIERVEAWCRSARAMVHIHIPSSTAQWRVTIYVWTGHETTASIYGSGSSVEEAAADVLPKLPAEGSRSCPHTTP